MGPDSTEKSVSLEVVKRTSVTLQNCSICRFGDRSICIFPFEINLERFRPGFSSGIEAIWSDYNITKRIAV
jgi:hypothetical protein